MSTTAKTAFQLPGGYGPQASTELATQIDASGDAVKLMHLGFSAPLANELATQMSGGTGDVMKLMALGVPPNIATAIKTAIDA